MRQSQTRKLNATAPLMLTTYPTKIDIRLHDVGIYHLKLHYLTPIDARLAAIDFRVESDDTHVNLFTSIIYSGSLTQALQNTFSCHYVELVK